MRCLTLVAAGIACLMMSGLSQADPQPPAGFRAIFNGRDLTGWYGWNPHTSAKLTGEKLQANLQQQRKEFADNWRVENGDLVNDGKGPYATTEAEFGDIELLLEYKTVAKADSGIYLRGTPQVQIWDTTKEGGKWDRNADKGSGGLFNNTKGAEGQLPLVLADKPFGEWNSFRIRQIGSRTWVWLNDQLVVDGAMMENYWDRSQPLPARGPIMLQTHGGEIRWRNIFVRDIPAAEATKSVSDADQHRTSPLPTRESFHLYLLMGQSNMAGRGVIENPAPAAHPRVFKFTQEKTWVPATDPLHFDKPIAGVGLGTSFAATMADANPQVTIGLIPCAVGGTPLSRWEPGGDLYTQAVERGMAAVRDGTLKGVLWHQGEGDSARQTTAENYAQRLGKMVQALRKQFGSATLPFVAGELGPFLKPETRDGKPSYWKVVNAQIHSLSERLPYVGVVSSAELKHKGDDVHFETASLREFGRRYAAAMQHLQSPQRLQSTAP
ncbi:MAG: sialate O-acetylesterase [Planctomycetaceae bacterium]